MNDASSNTTPVWALSTAEGAAAPAVTGHDSLTPERLAELRSALAVFADTPVVTLEAHPLASRRERSSGIPLDSVSPLAMELSRLISSTSAKVPAVAKVAESSEVLYRMVIPAKVASQVGAGLVKPMASKAVEGGVYTDLVTQAGRNLVTAKATLVPAEAARAGAAGTAAGAAAGTAAAGTALTVAAPLVLMAVAVGASAYADHQRQKAVENITRLLETLKDDQLKSERNQLEGCLDAIDKATAVLLDRGRVGASLGLDSAVHAISTAIRNAERRVEEWEASLGEVAENQVYAAELEKAFPGLVAEGGEFRAHLELAALAIALKRRVVVLQGVEAGQSDPDNVFESFAASLRDDQRRIDELERRIATVLLRISVLELRAPWRRRDSVMTRKQADELLRQVYKVRALGVERVPVSQGGDVVIEIEKHADGTLLVLPARAS